MAEYQLIIVGGGLSGLAAGIRAARFGKKVLILEQNPRPGGLNSYFFRHGFLLETGLHAMTNFAPPQDRQAPLNRLFRQLKLSRQQFKTHPQRCSEIIFPGHSLTFSNDFALLSNEVAREFPGCADRFAYLVKQVRDYDPFAAAPWRSAREFLTGILANPVLEEMILLPLMVYGNSEEHDMDLGQFVIMFRSILLEGFFRPHGTIRDFLDMLIRQFGLFEGEIRYRSRVRRILRDNYEVRGVVLDNGDQLTCNALLSTIGIPGTAELADWPLERDTYCGAMSFMETITIAPPAQRPAIRNDRTIIFYNHKNTLSYHRPTEAADPLWGVICFPGNFDGLPDTGPVQVRVTNAANYDLWKRATPDEYRKMKKKWTEKSAREAKKIIGDYQSNIIFQDSFTPTTIERFTAKAAGAVYGSPLKLKDGRTPYRNLFIGGTDQGYLGIIGSMLSGVSIVNRHLLQ